LGFFNRLEAWTTNYSVSLLSFYKLDYPIKRFLR
jgi:hypothetical protein